MTIVLPEWVFTFSILFLAFIAHEIGHWIIPQCEGLKPRFVIGFIIIGVAYDIEETTPIKILIDTGLLGIMFGIVPIIVLGNATNLSFLLIIYFLLCSVDIMDIVSMKIKAYRNNAHLWHEISS